MANEDLYEKIYGEFPSKYMEAETREKWRQQGNGYASDLMDYIHNFFYYRLADIETHDTWQLFTIEMMFTKDDRHHRSLEYKLRQYRDKVFGTFAFPEFSRCLQSLKHHKRFKTCANNFYRYSWRMCFTNGVRMSIKY